MRLRTWRTGTAMAPGRVALGLAALALVPFAQPAAGAMDALADGVVRGCDPEPDAALITAYDPVSGGRIIRAATIAGVGAACDGLVFTVTLANGTNAVVAASSYRDPAGPDGQVDPLLGGAQRVRLEFAGRPVRAGAVVFVAATVRRAG